MFAAAPGKGWPGLRYSETGFGVPQPRPPKDPISRRSLPLLLEDKHTLLVADDDIEQLVAIEIINHELSPYAGIIINDVRDKLGDAISALVRLEPIQHGGFI